jgi:hypothetical protein
MQEETSTPHARLIYFHLHSSFQKYRTQKNRVTATTGIVKHNSSPRAKNLHQSFLSSPRSPLQRKNVDGSLTIVVALFDGCCVLDLWFFPFSIPHF